MKNDLISRSLLSEELKKVLEDMNSPEYKLIIIKAIDVVYSQPTAFNLIGVLEKLKSRKEKIRFDFSKKGMLKNACYDDAFEIVKNGCKSKLDKKEWS